MKELLMEGWTPLSAHVLIGCLIASTGRYDDALAFWMLVSGFLFYLLGHYAVTNSIRSTDFVEAFLEPFHPSPEVIDTQMKSVIFCVWIIATTAFLVLLCSKTLWKYSPFLCLVLYVNCLSLVVKDAGAKSDLGHATCVLVIFVLSLFSSHIMRLHIASSIALSLWPDTELVPESQLTLCLHIGLVSLLFHDITIYISRRFRIPQIFYVLCTVVLIDDMWISQGKLTKPECYTYQAVVDKLSYGLFNEECTQTSALLYNIVFCIVGSIRILISPGYVWVKRQRVKAVAPLAFVILVISLYGYIYHNYIPSIGSWFGDVSSLLFIYANVVFLVLNDASRAKRSYIRSAHALVYMRDGFPRDPKSDDLYSHDPRRRTPTEPPFIIPPHEDIDIVPLEQQRVELMREHRKLSNKLGEIQGRIEKNTSDVVPYLLLLERARVITQAAVQLSNRAVVLENISRRLREIHADAETEYEILSVSEKYMKSTKQVQRLPAIHRQVENAGLSSAHSKKNSDASEVSSDAINAQAVQEIHKAVSYIRQGILECSGPSIEGGPQLVAELESLMTLLMASVNPLVMDQVQLKRLQQTLQCAPAAPGISERDANESSQEIENGRATNSTSEIFPSLASAALYHVDDAESTQSTRSSSTNRKWYQIFKLKKKKHIDS